MRDYPKICSPSDLHSILSAQARPRAKDLGKNVGRPSSCPCEWHLGVSLKPTMGDIRTSSDLILIGLFTGRVVKDTFCFFWASCKHPFASNLWTSNHVSDHISLLSLVKENFLNSAPTPSPHHNSRALLGRPLACWPCVPSLAPDFLSSVKYISASCLNLSFFPSLSWNAFDSVFSFLGFFFIF